MAHLLPSKRGAKDANVDAAANSSSTNVESICLSLRLRKVLSDCGRSMSIDIRMFKVQFNVHKTLFYLDDDDLYLKRSDKWAEDYAEYIRDLYEPGQVCYYFVQLDKPAWFEDMTRWLMILQLPEWNDQTRPADHQLYTKYGTLLKSHFGNGIDYYYRAESGQELEIESVLRWMAVHDEDDYLLSLEPDTKPSTDDESTNDESSYNNKSIAALLDTMIEAKDENRRKRQFKYCKWFY